MTAENVVPTHQIGSIDDPNVDIRPRFWCKLSNCWVLLDTGAQVSCCPPAPGDEPDPNLLVEAVDGSLMTCYGRKMQDFQIGRKTYHQQMTITNTTEVILGMDFIKRYRIDFRWGEFGDYLFYDTRAQISTPLEFVKFPKGSLPSLSRVAKISSPSSVQTPGHTDASWEVFQVAAV